MGCNKYTHRSKISKFHNLCDTVRTLVANDHKETVLKFYNVMAISVSLHGSECLTRTK